MAQGLDRGALPRPSLRPLDSLLSDDERTLLGQLRDLDILFLDALRHRPHPTHSNVENSLKLVERLHPQRAFFTHVSHDLGHSETNASLPKHVKLAHDGLQLEFEI